MDRKFLTLFAVWPQLSSSLSSVNQLLPVTTPPPTRQYHVLVLACIKNDIKPPRNDALDTDLMSLQFLFYLNFVNLTQRYISFGCDPPFKIMHCLKRLRITNAGVLQLLKHAVNSALVGSDSNVFSRSQQPFQLFCTRAGLHHNRQQHHQAVNDLDQTECRYILTQSHYLPIREYVQYIQVTAKIMEILE